MDIQRATKRVAFALATLTLVLTVSMGTAQPASATTYLPNFTTFQGSGPGVYLVANGGYYGIPNPETLTRCFGGWSAVRHVSEPVAADIRATYPYLGMAACRVDYPNGTTLMAPSSGTVFVIVNGHKYGVPNPETLNACLGGWGAVRHISDAEMAWTNDFYPYAGSYSCSAPQVGSREQRAAAWALAEVRSPRPSWSDRYNACWSGRCEQFVEQAYGRGGVFTTAYVHYQWQAARGRIHTDRSPPLGAIVFYSAVSNGVNYGHVAISMGNGTVAGTVGWMGQCLNTAVNALGYFPNYLGWAYAPDSWQ
jgi:hypothetical protein